MANEPLGGLCSQIDKIEAPVVKRMINGYQRLCTNCSTRLGLGRGRHSQPCMTPRRNPRAVAHDQCWFTCAAAAVKDAAESLKGRG
jgi:hypothetical protein